MVDIGILGPLEVRSDGYDAVPVAGTRLRRLLTRLAADAGRVVSTAELVDAVWIDDPPREVANALQSLVSRLRRTLGSADRVAQTRAGYRLAVPADTVDAHRLAGQVAAGRRALESGDARAARDELVSALALWRGDPLADADGALYAAAPVARWNELRLSALAARISADLALGGAADVVGELQELVVAYPLREQFVEQLMTALATIGRTGDALAAYETLRTRLADETGADPGRELQQCHVAILRGEVRQPTEGAGSHRAPELRDARTNVRAALSSFVGRAAELDRVATLIDEYRLTTIVGPGGAGKTRLAAETGRARAGRHTGGVWMVELAPLSDEAEIAPAVLEAVGYRDATLLERGREAPVMSAVDRVVDVLASADALLVMDNCEHLVDPVARFVAVILARCPDIRVLATSREALRVPGEALASVPPLGLPPRIPDSAATQSHDDGRREAQLREVAEYPAVQLLLERGRAASASFELTGETVRAVVDVVRRLDGLPLAIELAAARLGVLSITDIAARLSDRFALLTHGARTADERHRTLRAVVEWSWDLLTEPERLLLQRLSVFPGGITADSAAAVCAGSGLAESDIMGHLMQLADKSLLQVGSGVGRPGMTRFRILETIREYGAEKLAVAGELDTVRRRHADYWARRAHTLGPQLRAPEQLAAIGEFTTERDNFTAAARHFLRAGDGRAAATLVLDLCWFWTITGANPELDEWTAAVLRHTEGEDFPDRVRLQGMRLIGRATGPVDGDTEPWDAMHQRLTDLGARLAEIDDGSDPPTSLMRLFVDFFSSRGKGIDAIMVRGRASADPWVRAMSTVLHVMYLENDGDIARLRAEVNEACAELEDIGDRWGLSAVIAARAEVRRVDGDLDGAVNDYERALEMVRLLGAGDEDMLMHLKLARVREQQGEITAAHDHVAAVRAGSTQSPAPLEHVLMADAAELRLLLAARRTREASALGGELRARLPLAAGEQNPMRGHLDAIVGATCAHAAVAAGDTAAALADLQLAYPAALATDDYPILAGVGVAVAAYRAHAGEAACAADAAEILGAAAVLRGSDDTGGTLISGVRARVVARMGADAFEEHYAIGRALSRDEAVSRIDPVLIQGRESENAR